MCCLTFPIPCTISKIQQVHLKLPKVPDTKGTFTSSREQGGEVNSGKASGTCPSFDKVSLEQDKMNSGAARCSPKGLVRSKSKEDDHWSPEHIGIPDSIWDTIHQGKHSFH